MSSSSPLISRDRVIGVQFGVLGSDNIRKRSVVQVKSAATYEGNIPSIEGLFDPRMGVLDNRKICPTDGQTNLTCPGYFGHYELCLPVYNIPYLEVVRKILNCVCLRCGKGLICADSDEGKHILEKPLKNRFEEYYDKCGKVKFCGAKNSDGCGLPAPDKIIKKEDTIANLVAEYRTENSEGGTEASRRPLSIVQVLATLQKLTDEDCAMMGFDPRWSRPDWMILTSIPIPPPTIRPSVKHDNNQRSEDDITYKLSDIIKSDMKLRDKIASPDTTAEMIQEWHNIVQYHVATLVNNDLPDAPPSVHRLGRPLKSIIQRIVGKDGRIRGNLMGKRVDFSARTVITGDPNLSIRQLGVPLKIAMNLTVPERVTKFNIEKLQKCVDNGVAKYPGAKSIIPIRDGNTYSLRVLSRKRVILHEGDIVNRHMMDGDPVLFNRQPTLHRPSMMCHIVKVLPYNTFRMNVTDTTPYNADFDKLLCQKQEA
jgi:DNA-directed RNA polymerase II subunit RPB1